LLVVGCWLLVIGYWLFPPPIFLGNNTLSQNKNKQQITENQSIIGKTFHLGADN